MVAAAHVLDEADVRLISTFLRNPGDGPDGQLRGRQPVYGWKEQFQTDPHGRDLILYYEAFHSDSGAGIGASYHTSWTGAVVALIKANGTLPGWLQQIQHIAEQWRQQEQWPTRPRAGRCAAALHGPAWVSSSMRLHGTRRFIIEEDDEPVSGIYAAQEDHDDPQEYGRDARGHGRPGDLYVARQPVG